MNNRIFYIRAEPDKHERALSALAREPWATGLVSTARRRTATRGDLFELRFTYEVFLRGLSPVRPFRAGVGTTNIDFRVPHTIPWNIELLSVNESEAISRAREADEEDGVSIETLDLGLVDDQVENERRIAAKQTPEHDMQRMVSKLGEKVSDANGQPQKFPVPDGTFVNMLLVDVRSYLGGDGSIDRVDCRQMLYGPSAVAADLIAFDPKTGEPFRGLWDGKNRAPYAALARERIQVVGFVHEEEFADDEIRQVTRLYKAPGCQVVLADNPLGWLPPPADNKGLRAENALWTIG